MTMKIYTRREFLKAAGISAAAAVAAGCRLESIPAGALQQSQLIAAFSGPIKGVVTIGSKPAAGIAVSDGLDIVLTDAKGRYCLPNSSGEAPFVFVVQPDEAAKDSAGFYRMPFQLGPGQKKINFTFEAERTVKSRTKTRFVQITDIHTTNAERGKFQRQATDEILRLSESADFIVATGDLIEHWGKEDEFSSYTEAAGKSPIPYFNAIGNHDSSRQTTLPENYRRFVQPDYYSFDNGGVHFVIINSVTASERQNTWFEKDLAMLGRRKPVVVFQHYPPTSEQLRKLDLLNIHSIFTGHWHSERVVQSEKTISISTPSFYMGGIDFSPAGFRVVDIYSDGTMKTEYRPIGVSKMAKIAWPAGLICKSPREIIANIYDSSIDVKKVSFSLSQDGQLKASGELKKQSPLNWSADLPDSIPPGEAELSIEVEGLSDWKAKNNVTISDCLAPAIETAGDWPMFMGNAARTGVSIANLSSPLALAWSTSTGGDLDLSSLILAEGKLFVTVRTRRSDSFSGVMAIEPATGKIIWTFKTAQSINHSPAYESGVICAVEVGGRVYGICAENGKELWRHDLGDNIGRWIYNAPAADEGKFYVGSVNRFARIDAKTGQADWEKRLADGADNDWISTPVSPAVSDGFLAMGGFWIGKDNLFVVDKQTGEKIWSHPADRGMHSGLTIAGDYVLFFGKASLLHCCKLIDGETIWTKQVASGWSATTCAVKDDIIVTGSGDGVMTAMKLSDASEIWLHKSGESIFKISPYRTDNASVLSSPTIAGDKVLFASADGKLYCLDFATGKELWSFDFGVPVLSTPLVSGNGVFVAAYDGRVYAFSGERQKNNIECLDKRSRNESCHWQRPCRFHIQRGYQTTFDRTWAYS